MPNPRLTTCNSCYRPIYASEGPADACSCEAGTWVAMIARQRHATLRPQVVQTPSKVPVARPAASMAPARPTPRVAKQANTTEPVSDADEALLQVLARHTTRSTPKAQRPAEAPPRAPTPPRAPVATPQRSNRVQANHNVMRGRPGWPQGNEAPSGADPYFDMDMLTGEAVTAAEPDEFTVDFDDGLTIDWASLEPEHEPLPTTGRHARFRVDRAPVHEPFHPTTYPQDESRVVARREGNRFTPSPMPNGSPPRPAAPQRSTRTVKVAHESSATGRTVYDMARKGI